MSALPLWLAIGLSAVATYGLRAAFLTGDPSRPRLPGWLTRGLPFVAPAVLAALVTSSLAAHHEPAVVGSRAAALALAGLVAWRTRSVLATLTAGMSAVWVLGWLAGGA